MQEHMPQNIQSRLKSVVQLYEVQGERHTVQ